MATNRLRRKMINLIRERKGTTLLEALVGMAILGAIGVAFMSSVTTGMTGTRLVEQKTTAQIVAQAQLEETKNADYLVAPATYPTTVTPPSGYSVSIEAAPLPGGDDNIQNIKITVRQQDRVLLVMEDYKVNR